MLATRFGMALWFYQSLYRSRFLVGCCWASLLVSWLFHGFTEIAHDWHWKIGIAPPDQDLDLDPIQRCLYLA